MALERFFKDLSNGHEFFIDQAFGLARVSKTSCPEFSVATVTRAHFKGLSKIMP